MTKETANHFAIAFDRLDNVASPHNPEVSAAQRDANMVTAMQNLRQEDFEILEAAVQAERERRG